MFFFSETVGQIFSSPEHEVLRVSYCDSAELVMHHQLFALCML